MIHRRALDPIADDILSGFSLEKSDVFNTNLLHDQLKKSLSARADLSLGVFTKSSFSFKLNERALIHFVPKVTVKFDNKKNEVLIQQEYTSLDRAYQRFGFMIILIVGGMFLILPAIGGIVDFILERKLPISNWSEFGALLILLFFLLSAFISINFFNNYREKFWNLSKVRTVDMLNLAGVKSINSYNQVTVIRRRFSET